MTYRILDVFFVVFHTSLIVFNISGWLWKKTRKWNLVTLGLTGASWLFLGMIVGVPGYCPFTDWHFRVLEKIGKTDLPNSYIKYLAGRLTGLDISPDVVDSATLWTYIIVVVVSLSLNARDYFKRPA